MLEKRGKVFALFLLGLFMIGFFGTVLVSAADTLSGSFSSLFSKWSSATISSNVAKIFFFLMIGFIIFLILSSIFGTSFGKSRWVLYVLSFLIAFLATAYITPQEVYSLLISYTALGLTITTLIPLAVLFGLTYRAAIASEGKVPLIMLQYFAWILFALYSIYRFIYDWGWGHEGSTTMNIIILVTAIVAVLIALNNKRIVRKLAQKYVESSAQAAGDIIDKSIAFHQKSADALQKLSSKGS